MELDSAVVNAAAQHAQATGEHIEAAAISNQRETAIAWTASTGEPLANAVSWQCGRSAEICDRLSAKSDLFRNKTGLPLASLVSASKWAWLIENQPAVQKAIREPGYMFRYRRLLADCSPGRHGEASDRSDQCVKNGASELGDACVGFGSVWIFGIPLEAMPDAENVGRRLRSLQYAAGPRRCLYWQQSVILMLRCSGMDILNPVQ